MDFKKRLFFLLVFCLFSLISCNELVFENQPEPGDDYYYDTSDESNGNKTEIKPIEEDFLDEPIDSNTNNLPQTTTKILNFIRINFNRTQIKLNNTDEPSVHNISNQSEYNLILIIVISLLILLGLLATLIVLLVFKIRKNKKPSQILKDQYITVNQTE
ncbi:unnamed protein product [Brachionus calyciflorus]|uniref:Uncharacterized protein n=1 Tax=Brachionus calyciflorus TaxID=104777 RepID=A0A813YR13_9BILA|nr:unnamed protein product [Brachionus calyciflorus]